MTSDIYHRIWEDAGQVRRFLGPLIAASPELFPLGMQEGYHLTGMLPDHLAADEHHAKWCGEKGYIAFTAGAGCVLGVVRAGHLAESGA